MKMKKAPRRSSKSSKTLRTLEPPLPHLYDAFAKSVFARQQTPDQEYLARRHRPISKRSMHSMWRWAYWVYGRGKPLSEMPDAYLPECKAPEADPVWAATNLLWRLAARIYPFCEDHYLTRDRDFARCLKAIRTTFHVPSTIGDRMLARMVRGLNTHHFRTLDRPTRGALLRQARHRRSEFLRDFTNLA